MTCLVTEELVSLCGEDGHSHVLGSRNYHEEAHYMRMIPLQLHFGSFSCVSEYVQ